MAVRAGGDIAAEDSGEMEMVADNETAAGGFQREAVPQFGGFINRDGD